MVKAKCRQMGGVARNKGKAFGSHTDSSAEWVLVKKQKITILIPPAAAVGRRKALRTNHANLRRKTVVHARSLGGGPHKFSFGESRLAGVPYRRRKFPSSTLEEAELKDPTHLVRESPEAFVLDHHSHSHSYGGGHESSKALFGAPKALVKRPTVAQSSSHHGPMMRPMGCLNVGGVQNRVMRAANLEKKIAKAGGLSRWLVSLGLGGFVMMFRRRNVDKFQLSNMSMAKLKEMGANAVGPRRKLIHAIDCVSPYCFRSF